ncbi:uncharacterized protein ACNLHF_002547 [Anomaloglossus baeobatrachus]
MEFLGCIHALLVVMRTCAQIRKKLADLRYRSSARISAIQTELQSNQEPPEEQGAAEDGEPPQVYVPHEHPEPPVELQPPEEEEHPHEPPAGSAPDGGPGSISPSVSDEGENRIPTLAELVSSQATILASQRRLMAAQRRLMAKYMDSNPKFRFHRHSRPVAGDYIKTFFEIWAETKSSLEKSSIRMRGVRTRDTMIPLRSSLEQAQRLKCQEYEYPECLTIL